ncbi:co-chaperone DjlA [Neisseria sp. Ec49-e6-T10]|uniref:co-chaperone DjlA n=1 Tax=Neisseria sp. Ec49-e6-T10 TaxID=3140744 RepID=UPI003EBB62E9
MFVKAFVFAVLAGIFFESYFAFIAVFGIIYCADLFFPSLRGDQSDRPQNPDLFFRVTFEVLGHVSKAKGIVTKDDIHFATQTMAQMKLDAQSRQEAQQAFERGKSPYYPLNQRLNLLYQYYQHAPYLLQFFTEVQIRAACNDGQLAQGEAEILFTIAQEFNISRQAFERYVHSIQGSTRFYNQSTYQQQNHYNGSGSHRYGQDERYDSSSSAQYQQDSLQDAYEVLGIDENADTAKIKRAYRKLMQEHHPDKLASKGLPEEMMELAKQRTQEIHAAYDLIKKHKGFK